MKEAYCSEKVSEMLKKKGFDEPCVAFWEYGLYEYSLYIIGYPMTNSDLEKELLDGWSAPTHQMAMAWLREKHNIFLGVGFGADNRGDFLFMADIYDLTNDAIGGRYVPIVEADEYLTKNPKSPEEAIEEALKYVLENLI